MLNLKKRLGQKIKTTGSILLIGSLLLVVLAPAGAARGASVSELEKQKQQLQSEIEQNRQRAATKEKEAAALQNKVDAIQGDISATEGEIAKTSGEVISVRSEIGSVKKQISARESELAVEKGHLDNALIEIYRMGRRSNLEKLLGSSDLAAAVSQETYLLSIEQQIDGTIKKITKIKEDLQSQKASLEGQETKLSGLLSQQEAQERALSAQRNYTDKLKQGAEQAADEAIAAARTAERKMGSVDDAIRRALAAQGGKSVGYLTGKSVGAGTVIGYMGSTGNSTGPHLHLEVRQGSSGDGNINDFLNVGYYNTSNPASNCSIGMNGNNLALNFGLAKPMSNPRYITACWGWGGYGDSGFHGGVDMVEYNGAPILAARSGVVVFHGYLGGWGNAVVIYHGGGLWTLYGHML